MFPFSCVHVSYRDGYLGYEIFFLGDLFLHSDIVVIFACKSMLTDSTVPFSSCRT